MCEDLMSVSCSVTVQGISGSTQLVALLAIIPRASYMFHFNVILHVCCVLADMFTISALPSTRGVLEHLGTNQII